MLPSPKLRAARAVISTMLLLFATMLVSTPVFAQSDSNPKWDLFVGYQWLHPGITVPAPFGSAFNPTPFKVPDMAKGFGSALTYNFDPHLGLEFDLGHNWGNSNYETTASVGPRLMFRTDGANYFLHALASYNRLAVSGLDTHNGIGAVLGAGIDLPIAKRVSLRLFEADFVWAHHNYADNVGPQFTSLRRPNGEGVRLRTGRVFNWGGAPALTPSASCSVQPTEVMVGEPVTVTVSTTNFNPKHTLTYGWSGNGVSGNDTTVKIETASAAPGSYTVTVHVTDPKTKNNNEASCSANYTVKPLPPKNPPTISCSASPSTVQAGGTSTITCNASSPDGGPGTVSNWTSSAGTISGTDNTATLNTTGVAPGAITVNATATDARGLTAQGSTQVTVENPPPPPPQASKLSQCDFTNEKKRWRVDNTCKAVLDDVAKSLQQNPDNKLIIVGNADPAEKRKNLAAERAVDSKAYLTGGEAKQGIDPSRIEVRVGSGGTKTAEYWIVPSGANFDSAGTQTVDETKVKAVPDHPKPVAKKKRTKKPS